MIINYNNVTNRMREIIANHSIAKKGNYAIIGGIGNWLYEIYNINTYERVESKAFVGYSIEDSKKQALDYFNKNY